MFSACCIKEELYTISAEYICDLDKTTLIYGNPIKHIKLKEFM